MAKKVLLLTLRREFFDQIVTGKKREEYRELKPYWKTRIEGRTYDEIHFRNGYTSKVPFMRVKYHGWKFQRRNGTKCYALQLGKILELKYYKPIRS